MTGRRVTRQVAELIAEQQARPPERSNKLRYCVRSGCRTRLNQYNPSDYCGAHRLCSICSRGLVSDTELEHGVCDDCVFGTRKE